MRPPPQSRAPKAILWFDCGRYFVRTVKREDASERWAAWLSDPWATQVLNAPGRSLQRKDVIDYIKGFDNRTRLLLGIFEKGTRRHLGIIRCDVDLEASRCTLNIMIGEADYRGK